MNKSKLSESIIIQKYLKKLHFNKFNTFNYQNDGAILKLSKNTVITNDAIAEKVDFFSNDPPESIAQKIICSNLSDISAMGAVPITYTLSLCLSSKLDNYWLQKFTNKLFSLQKKYKFYLIGGDISKSKDIILSASFIGKLTNRKTLMRKTGKINDDIWVTGNIGESYVGLLIKKKKLIVNSNLKKYFIKKYQFPQPCMIGKKIINIASSAIDISDGLLGDLQKLKNDNLGANIDYKKIPYSKNLNYLLIREKIHKFSTLTNGDDYEILFTSNLKNRKKINNLSRKYRLKITRIGRIIKNQGIYLNNKNIYNEKKSYQHFF